MKGAIMQPTYLPWLGYFAMIDDVELFIFLDDVQLEKRSWQVRNRIKECDGKELMLSIPLHTLGRDVTRICDAQFADSKWYIKHLASIRQCYRKSKYYNEIFPFIEDIYRRDYRCLSDFNICFITTICEYLQIKTPLKKSSDFKNILGSKDELLVNICNACGIDRYLSAKGSAIYIENKEIGGAFSKTRIQLEYQNYRHPQYKQLGNEFMPYMGIIDLLFNEGEHSLSIIRSGVRCSYTSENVFEGNDE